MKKPQIVLIMQDTDIVKVLTDTPIVLKIYNYGKYCNIDTVIQTPKVSVDAVEANGAIAFVKALETSFKKVE